MTGVQTCALPIFWVIVTELSGFQGYRILFREAKQRWNRPDAEQSASRFCNDKSTTCLTKHATQFDVSVAFFTTKIVPIGAPKRISQHKYSRFHRLRSLTRNFLRPWYRWSTRLSFSVSKPNEPSSSVLQSNKPNAGWPRLLCIHGSSSRENRTKFTRTLRTSSLQSNR